MNVIGLRTIFLKLEFCVTNNKYFCLLFSMASSLFTLYTIPNLMLLVFFLLCSEAVCILVYLYLCFFFLSFSFKCSNEIWFKVEIGNGCAGVWQIMRRGTYWLRQISNKTNIFFSNFSNKRNRSNLFCYTRTTTSIYLIHIYTNFNKLSTWLKKRRKIQKAI